MTDEQFLGYLTIIAIILGPIMAVVITRWADNRRHLRQRRMAIFRDLMGTRRMRLNVDHVRALNLVEIEFSKEKLVIDMWRDYMENLSQRVDINWPKAQTDQFFDGQEKLLARLLHAIAKSLKFEIDQLDIFKGGYLPQGWSDDDIQQHALRNLLIELLRGNRALSVTPVVNPTPQMPFPPPPTIDQPGQPAPQIPADPHKN
jgi:hypothetical protein